MVWINEEGARLPSTPRLAYLFQIYKIIPVILHTFIQLKVSPTRHNIYVVGSARLKNIMQFAVYHGSKGKGSGGGIGNHIDRTIGMEHTYPHADPGRRDLNTNFDVGPHHAKPLPQAINDRIKEGFKGKRKIRRDAVKYMAHVLTGSPERMQEIFSDKELANEWIQSNYSFIADEFGQENIIRFVLHMDEKTPHLHAITVPLTPDGRLSARERMGNKKDLQLRQDRYAERMEKFGLQRGIKGTGIKHENAKEYYGRIEQAEKEAISAIAAPSKNILGNYTKESVLEMQNSLKSSKMALNDTIVKLKREKRKTWSKSQEAEREKKKYQQAYAELRSEKERNQEMADYFVRVIKDPKEIEKARKEIAEMERQEKIKNQIGKTKGREHGHRR